MTGRRQPDGSVTVRLTALEKLLVGGVVTLIMSGIGSLVVMSIQNSKDIAVLKTDVKYIQSELDNVRKIR